MRNASNNLPISYPEFVDKKTDKLTGGLMFVRVNDNDFQLIVHGLSFPLNFEVSTFNIGDSVQIVQDRIQDMNKTTRGKNGLFLK